MNKKLTTKIGFGLASCLALVLSVSPLASAATAAQTYKSVDAALAYIESKQAADGSIATWDDSGEWSAIAFSAAGVDLDEVNNSGTSLLDYFTNTKDLDSSSYKYAYSLEQRILALHAAGYDVTNFEGVDYIQSLVDLLNDDSIYLSDSTYDDIFGLITVYAIKDARLLPYAQPLADDIAGLQQNDGGYCSSVACGWGSDGDSTSFAYAALALAKQADLELTSGSIANSLSDALSYIEATQQSYGVYGAWGPSLTSTAIVGTAFNTVGDDTSAINDALIAGQEPNGSFGEAFGIDTYTPAFAVLSLLGTNWLLNPAPIVRPIVVAEPTETEIVTGDYQAKEYTPQLNSNTTYQPVLSQTSEPAPQEDSTSEVKSSQDQNKNKEVVTEEKSSNNFLKFLGYGLIITAAVGLAVYFALGSGKQSKA